MELICRPKHEAIQLIVENTLTESDIVSVSYEKSGKCILAQGSKLVHHVTKVESAIEDRISLIISLTPRNAYQPDLTVFHSMKKLDTNCQEGIPEYEYFRQKAWQCRVSENVSEILMKLTIILGNSRRFLYNHQIWPRHKRINRKSRLTKSSPNINIIQLRSVSEELTRTADLIEGKICDKIGFFAETGDSGSKWLDEN